MAVLRLIILNDKLKHREFHLSKKNFFTLMLAGSGVSPPGDIPHPPGAIPVLLIWVTLPWQGVGLDGLQRSLPPPTML